MNEDVLVMSEWATIRQAARLKQVSEEAVRMFIRLHRAEIETMKVGATVLVKRESLLKYKPRGDLVQ